jgi:glycosyltransferase involved in cell wall biosynthesis
MSRRILLLITDLQIGGTPTVVRELASRLNAPPGVTVEVACLSEAGPVAKQLRERGVDVHPLGARGPGDLPRTISRLLRLVRGRRFDTVFSFLMHANVVAAVAARWWWGDDVRLLQSIQTTQPWPWWHWRLQSLAQEQAGRIVVPSASVATAARDWAGVPAEKIVVIPNAVDVPAGAATPRGEPRPPYRVGFIGRLHPVKRVPDLLRALAQLPRDYATLDVFGDGPARPEIESAIGALGIADRVTLHGSVPRADEALASMDVLVLPSEAEGLPVVPIEAMAAGVPVVATDVPGTRDVVRHESTGLLVPSGDPPSLARAIRRVLDDPKLRESLIAAGKRAAAERFAWPAVLEQYRQVLGL